MACVWCGHAVEEGERLTLDHCVPYAKGGSNSPSNLVTACLRCNSARGKRSVPAFSKAVAEYTEQSAQHVLDRVRRHVRRALPREEARELMNRRG